MSKAALKEHDLEAGPKALERAEAWNEANTNLSRWARAEVIHGKWEVIIYVLTPFKFLDR